MLARHQLDHIAQRITGQDIRLVGCWESLPGLQEYTAEYSRELGVSEGSLLRCRDIVAVLDLGGDKRASCASDDGYPSLL